MIQTIPTPYGDMTAHWNRFGLESLRFSDHNSQQAEQTTEVGSELPGTDDVSAMQRENAAQLAAAFESFFETGSFDFPIDLCDMRNVPTFHRKVLIRCAEIAPGKTMTYGKLADAVGCPGAARAVGQAMAKNRWPLLIPCHRVVGHSGRMTGYSGRGGTDTKRKLLDFEASVNRQPTLAFT
ncbi:MAG: MGMT family protein [Pirellulales bacterium]